MGKQWQSLLSRTLGTGPVGAGEGVVCGLMMTSAQKGAQRRIFTFQRRPQLRLLCSRRRGTTECVQLLVARTPLGQACRYEGHKEKQQQMIVMTTECDDAQ